MVGSKCRDFKNREVSNVNTPYVITPHPDDQLSQFWQTTQMNLYFMRDKCTENLYSRLELQHYPNCVNTHTCTLYCTVPEEDAVCLHYM